jgi:hypothetical protein
VPHIFAKPIGADCGKKEFGRETRVEPFSKPPPVA